MQITKTDAPRLNADISVHYKTLLNLNIAMNGDHIPVSRVDSAPHEGHAAAAPDRLTHRALPARLSTVIPAFSEARMSNPIFTPRAYALAALASGAAL
ncbi:hypothetical protein [Phaeovulum sp.]|uniref:hypothetical protein n=1 Tax=Phaeovulum sp. TaxID=2934796 RepID=UPI0039E44D2C